MNRKILCLCVGAVMLVASSAWGQIVKTAPGDGWQKEAPRVEPATKAVGEIEKLMASGDYVGARYLAKKYIKSGKDQERDHSLFLLGKTNFYLDDYDGCIDRFGQLREEYGEGRFEREIAEFEFAIATSYLQGRKRRFLGMNIISADEEGLKLMRLVTERVPFSLRAEQAIIKMAEYYVGERRYSEAKQEYEFLVNNYKNSQFIEEAEFSIVICLFKMNDGVPYDRGPLVEARDALKFYMEKYPNGRFEAEGKVLAKRIIETLARKDLMTAEFYLRRGDVLSAKHYYRMAVNNYPGTNTSKMARLRARTAVVRNR